MGNDDGMLGDADDRFLLSSAEGENADGVAYRGRGCVAGI